MAISTQSGPLMSTVTRFLKKKKKRPDDSVSSTGMTIPDSPKPEPLYYPGRQKRMAKRASK